MELIILGCSSALPTSASYPSSQHLKTKDHNFLIDCGEGTQIQLRKYKIKFSRINYILISHLHGDHYFGLPGLLSSFNLLNRESPITIFGPTGIKEVLDTIFKFSMSNFSFDIQIHEISSNKSELLIDDKHLQVRTIPLDHRIYSNGFLFTEKTKNRNLNMEKIKSIKEITYSDYKNLKKGKDFILSSGEIISNEELTFPPKPSFSYAYCSDTGYFENIIPLVSNVTYLYHESTFLSENLDLALKTKHSTAKQAGQIAQLAKAKNLILGHFSSRYKDLTKFLDEASEIYPNSILGEPGLQINFEKGIQKQHSSLESTSVSL